MGVVLLNHSDDDIRIRQGFRIAYIILEKIAAPDVEEVGHWKIFRDEQLVWGV